MTGPIVRLAVSGTYSSGKSTTTEALSIATGIPRTHAMTAREILMDVAPGKQLTELSAAELLALGLRRLEERIHHEAAQPGSFVSDGSVIHEWIYGQARMRMGIHPGAGQLLRLTKAVVGLPSKRFYRQYMDAYGMIVKARARRSYDSFIHLPVEFVMKTDGHRPVSEDFRALSDELLIATLDELQIPYILVRGTVQQRLEQITERLGLPIVTPLDEAVAKAQERVAASLAVIEADSRYHDAQRAKSLTRRMKYALRY
jgi:nicotinamide riboside kinase